MKYDLSDKDDAAQIHFDLARLMIKKPVVELKEVKQTRTIKQNSALHLFFTHLAEELNGAGLDMRKTLKPSVEIPWSAETVKDYLWRPIQKAQLGKESTTELSTKDIDVVYDTLNRHLGDKFGLHTEFPSIDGLLLGGKNENSNNPRSV